MKIQIKDLKVLIDKKEILSNISFDIMEKDNISIMGDNGTGKSTLLKSIMGLVNYEGEIIFKDLDRIKDIGFVFQNPEEQFVTSNVFSELIFRQENMGIAREEMESNIDSVLTKLNLIDFKNKDIAELSGGEKQRVALATQLVVNKKVLLLDEPTSMLDSLNAKQFNDLISSLDVTVVRVTHKLSETKNSNKIFELVEGNLRRVK